jgi:hypothetical protein
MPTIKTTATARKPYLKNFLSFLNVYYLKKIKKYQV